MKWKANRQSDNVEDRRGSGGGMPVFGDRSIGIGTIVRCSGWLGAGDQPLTILGCSAAAARRRVQVPAQRPPADDTMARFVSTVLADTEDVAGVFRQQGGNYQQPRPVLFLGGHTHGLWYRGGDGAVLLSWRPQGASI